MKRPGNIVAASKESEVEDELLHLSSRERILEALRHGPLSMNKISIHANVNPRTTRTHLADLMSRNLIHKSECQQCGSHMTYKIA